MKKITILIALCAAMSVSAWAQRGPGRGGMGMGPGPMGRGPGAGMMLDQPVPSDDQTPQTQPQPAPENFRPKANAQRFQDIPPVVRQWLQNGGWAILRERFAQRMQMRQGPRAGMGQGQPIEPGMRMGARGMGMPGMGPGMRGRGLRAPQIQSVPYPRWQGRYDCPYKAGIRAQGPRQDRGQFNRMAPMGGMGMMQRFGQAGPDQPRDIPKFRPEIRKFEGFMDKGDKANSPEAKFQKDRKDKDNKAAVPREKKPVKKDKDEKEDDDHEDNQKDR